ncbi:M23 family metallopeptidase [Marinilabiliaceae bacterium JC017]|nr:M23 family metallopeptidase [Marinilabiliaceae bacterium JC017]
MYSFGLEGNSAIGLLCNRIRWFFFAVSSFKWLQSESGAALKQGDVIGFVGNSGLSVGPHLHFELKKDGERINPAKSIDLQ